MNVSIPLETENVRVYGFKMAIVCKKDPHHKYGVYLLSDGSLPEDWDICRKCQELNNGRKKENVQNGSNSR